MLNTLRPEVGESQVPWRGRKTPEPEVGSNAKHRVKHRRSADSGALALELYCRLATAVYLEVLMVLGKAARGGLIGIVVRWASRLRFPYIFLLTAVLFVLNLFIPDVVPMVDELIMGLLAALLASLRKKPESKEVTPPTDNSD